MVIVPVYSLFQDCEVFVMQALNSEFTAFTSFVQKLSLVWNKLIV